MIWQRHPRIWHYPLLISLGIVIFFANLGGATLWDVDEGRNATCAYEMLISGNWIVPTFNATLRIDKPALLYWLQVFSYCCFGVNEFAARFPSAVAALGTVLLCYELARSMFSRTTGLLAGVIVATMPMLCTAARFANPDALLNLCTVLSLSVFWFGLPARRWWWFIALGVASGLAVLAKGPVGFVLPAAVVFLFLLWQRQLRVYLDARWLLTCATFTLTALPWYVWVGLETHGEFLEGFLLKHNLERGMSAMENHGGFPGYYVCVLLVFTMPWSIFLFASWWFGFWSAVRSPWQRFQAQWTACAEVDARRELDGAYRLLCCWIGVYGLFFALAATKLPNYILPVIVPCAILIARFLRRWQTGELSLPDWLSFSSIAALLLVGVLLSLGLALGSGLVEMPLLRGRFIPELQPWTFVGLIPAGAGALGWWFLRRRQFTRYIVTIAVAAALLLGPIAIYASVIFNQHKVPRPLVEEAQALRLDEDIRIGCWQLEYLPSLNFYVKRNVEHLKDPKELAAFLRSPLPSYLFMPLEEWEQLQPSLRGWGHAVARHHDLYRFRDVVVVTNR